MLAADMHLAQAIGFWVLCCPLVGSSSEYRLWSGTAWFKSRLPVNPVNPPCPVHP